MRDAQVRADHNPQDLEAAALAYATNTVHAWLSAYQLRAELAATEGETE